MIRRLGRTRMVRNARTLGSTIRTQSRTVRAVGSELANTRVGKFARSRRGAAAMGVGVLATAVARSSGPGATSTSRRGRPTGMYMY